MRMSMSEDRQEMYFYAIEKQHFLQGRAAMPSRQRQQVGARVPAQLRKCFHGQRMREIRQTVEAERSSRLVDRVEVR